MFAVGDRVRLSSDSELLGKEHNPDSIYIIGVIIGIHPNPREVFLPIGVEWEDGCVNTYGIVDLIKVDYFKPRQTLIKFYFLDYDS